MRHIDNDVSNNKVENLQWSEKRRRVNKKPEDDLIDLENKELVIEEEDTSKVIYQLDENNTIIKEWIKIADIGRALGLNPKRISGALCSDKNKFHGNYFWYYKKDYDSTKTQLLKKPIKEKPVINYEAIANEFKHCPKCDKDVLISDFGKNKNYKDGLQIYCKACSNSYKTNKNQKKRDERLVAETRDEEEWSVIANFSMYEVSTHGRVRNITSKRIMSSTKDENGQYKVSLVNNDNKKSFSFVHRLVAIAFIPNPEKKPNVHHIDKDNANNKVENLCWTTNGEKRENQNSVENHIIKTTNDLTNLENEDWKRIEGFDNYEISNKGRIKYLKQYGNKISKYVIKYAEKDPENNYYVKYSLRSDNDIIKYKLAHRLVAKAFIPNQNKLPEVNHKNGIKNDNVVENLEWVTGAENKRHARITGLNNSNKKIYQLDGNNKIIKEWPSETDAADELKLKRSSISSAANNKHNQFYENYFWCFKEDYDPSVTKLFKSMRVDPVTQLDLEGNIIKIHDSIKEAGEEIAKISLLVARTCSTQISKCAKGKAETFEGYKWEFARKT